ncbi:MAG: hypothetical protein JWO36_1849 [Myxococcales bacterium]|nr:hypothetical protein [Myxococcales bacterium]
MQCGVDSRRVIWILLVILTVVGGVAAVGVASNERRKALGPGSVKALPEGGQHVERSVRDLRVDDILTIDGHDFVVEGLIAYDEDGHRWIAGRCVDDRDVRWIVVGIERAGAGATRMLEDDDTLQLAGYPPEAIVVGEVRYALDKRGTATAELRGDVGSLAGLTKDRPPGHVERCRWWLYNAPGEDTLLVEQWGSDFRALRGKKVGEGTIDLMQAS